MTTTRTVTSLPRCQECGSPARHLRHSERWDFDVVRCRNCRTVFVAGTEQAARSAPAESADEDIDWDGYSDVMRDDDAFRRSVLSRIRAKVASGPAGGRPLLFDVGAGDGAFLVLARDNGFAVSGNELSRTAISQAAELHDVTLSPDMLDQQPAGSVDAISMWCVVAHVPEPAAFLREAYAMLRPGGVLFLRTPRWCLVDRVGFGLDRVSRGRLPELADRRVFPGHWHMFNQQSMAGLLDEIGFEQVQVEPHCHYALKTSVIIDGTGGPLRMLSKGVGLVDRMIERQWVPRNTLMVYARRPLSR